MVKAFPITCTNYSKKAVRQLACWHQTLKKRMKVSYTEQKLVYIDQKKILKISQNKKS